MPSHRSAAQQVLGTARKSTKRKSAGRRDFSSSTKKALIDSATELFTERGYAGTSLDEVVAAARVTKGALYHHFPSKLALFESVFMEIQQGATLETKAILAKIKDPWERAEVGVSTFLEVCRRPEFRRICLQEGPVALGHERWQEVEREASFGIVQETVTSLLKEVSSDLAPLDAAFGAVFYGALRSSAEFVADAEDPEDASDQVLASIGTILLGMRSLRADD